MNGQAEQFFTNAKKWKDEFLLLREIVSENKLLEEDYKWMHPCYTFKGKNIVLIHGFKEYCALLFHKGALLKDPDGVLIRQTENVQSARQIRFTSVEQISTLSTTIAAYINEAIENEKSGKKVAVKKVSDYPMPEEFQRVLDGDHNLNAAFYALSLGRQKAYLFYFNQAKQAKTREARIERYYTHILNGKGIND
ncbi:YdeI/OmpD-associated family protein [Sinomicrobium sp.]